MNQRFFRNWLLATSVLMIAADQGLKAWVNLHLNVLDRMAILGQNILIISRILNRGIAGDNFSWIPNGSIEPYTRYFPTLVLALVGVIAFIRFCEKNVTRSELTGLTLLLAGGASNLFNHWTAAFVTDPLQIYIGSGQYIPFNVADVGIVIGVLLILRSIGALVWLQFTDEEECQSADR